MSMAAQIDGLVEAGKLVPYPMLVRSSPRKIYMSICVADMVDAAWEDSDDAVLFAQCRALLEDYVRNNWIRLRWDPDQDVPANIARVRPPGLYVFDFRSKGKDGGIRVFGAFAAKDWFVALTWEFRNEVDWDFEPTNCLKTWIDLFNTAPPYLGSDANDYLSSNYSIAHADG